ncbi:hypothetical protein A3K63_01540 [Candidatus Micrarchaeota archaeon RBG_16_49_10]|nr:MAG: hypothetical protein A3K63_01540 [Candidatus Micrarchaeota archaeon RBG_16_49_10]
MKRKSDGRGRIAGALGGISGGGSIISAHNVCHSVCLAVVAFLSIFGIAASSDVLMFLESYNLLFWSMGIFFLALSLLLYFKFPKCMSKKMILANAGLLIIGIPFVASLNLLFWVAGGVILSYSIAWYAKDKIYPRVS